MIVAARRDELVLHRHVAVSLNWGSFNRGLRAPLKGFAVDQKQVSSRSWSELHYGCFPELGAVSWLSVYQEPYFPGFMVGPLILGNSHVGPGSNLIMAL